jgi:hypothetical protein
MAAKLSAQLRGMPREGDSSIDPHKAGKFWQQMALGLLKGGLQAAYNIRRESVEKALRHAEAAEEQARADKRTLEAELDREHRTSAEGS